jgi:hypothetical protein
MHSDAWQLLMNESIAGTEAFKFPTVSDYDIRVSFPRQSFNNDSNQSTRELSPRVTSKNQLRLLIVVIN